MRPVIGILTRYDANQRGRSLNYVFDSTRTAILKMGGNPLLLCPMQNIEYYDTKYRDYVALTEEEKRLALYWLDMCDGLFIPGGSKISPYDFFILEEALKRGLPVLGVCLGMQLLSNYHKEEFILKEVENKQLHNTVWVRENEAKPVHKVLINKNSKLYEIIGKEEIAVNSFHSKEALKNDNFNTVAFSEDGVIEGIELKNYPFCMGVQWHPELMLDTDINSVKIFEYFMKEALKHKNRMEVVYE